MNLHSDVWKEHLKDEYKNESLQVIFTDQGERIKAMSAKNNVGVLSKQIENLKARVVELEDELNEARNERGLILDQMESVEKTAERNRKLALDAFEAMDEIRDASRDLAKKRRAEFFAEEKRATTGRR